MRCQRCGGSVLREPYADANSAGVALLCLSCGHTQEIPTKVHEPELWTRADETPARHRRLRRVAEG